MTKPSLAVDTSPRDKARPLSEVREAHDAEHHLVLKRDPSDIDALTDIALDESFPTSDAPGHAPPGSAEPKPSSGYDEKAEASIMRGRKRKAATRSIAGIGLPIAFGIGVLAVGLWFLTKDDYAYD
jgi:hypothetical protein